MTSKAIQALKDALLQGNPTQDVETAQQGEHERLHASSDASRLGCAKSPKPKDLEDLADAISYAAMTQKSMNKLSTRNEMNPPPTDAEAQDLDSLHEEGLSAFLNEAKKGFYHLSLLAHGFGDVLEGQREANRRINLLHEQIKSLKEQGEKFEATRKQEMNEDAAEARLLLKRAENAASEKLDALHKLVEKISLPPAADTAKQEDEQEDEQEDKDTVEALHPHLYVPYVPVERLASIDKTLRMGERITKAASILWFVLKIAIALAMLSMVGMFAKSSFVAESEEPAPSKATNHQAPASRPAKHQEASMTEGDALPILPPRELIRPLYPPFFPSHYPMIFPSSRNSKPIK